MVRANCRIQFTRSDVDFLLTHASKHTLSRIGSRSDLTVEQIDWLLDDETVFRRPVRPGVSHAFSAHFLAPHPHGHLEATARNQIPYQ